MKKFGKILCFSAESGQGMIMSSEKKKINFSVADWEDFETMPSLGLEVNFTDENNIVSSIVSLNYIEKSDATAEETMAICKPESSQEEEISAEENPANSTIKKEPVQDFTDTDSQKLLPEHFETDLELTLLLGSQEDHEEEVVPREESVTVTMNVSQAVTNYFNTIQEHVQKRASYAKVDGRLNYILIRRFLWTTFNNLSEIDLHIINPKLKALSDDLRVMAKVYNDFRRKTKYPSLAYEEVFLSCQAEYKKIRNYAEAIIQRLTILRTNEKYVGRELKIKKVELSNEINTNEFDVLQTELKSLNGTYVDIVHMMAELDERYKHDMKLLSEFEQEYREDFYKLFNESAKKHNKSILDILSAQAFTLDKQLWEQAKLSKAVNAHFHKANISGEFNTKTYLKYYLDSQDTKKASEETKVLYELYKYMASLEKDNIMIMLSDAGDAIEFESTINKADNSFLAKAFIDEKSSLKWALRNSVKVLIVENDLAKMSLESYLYYYKKYIVVIPKIILLGNAKKYDLYAIQKLLPRGTSALMLANQVKEILGTNKEAPPSSLK